MTKAKQHSSFNTAKREDKIILNPVEYPTCEDGRIHLSLRCLTEIKKSKNKIQVHSIFQGIVTVVGLRELQICLQEVAFLTSPPSFHATSPKNYGKGCSVTIHVVSKISWFMANKHRSMENFLLQWIVSYGRQIYGANDTGTRLRWRCCRI